MRFVLFHQGFLGFEVPQFRRPLLFGDYHVPLCGLPLPQYNHNISPINSRCALKQHSNQTKDDGCGISWRIDIGLSHTHLAIVVTMVGSFFHIHAEIN